MEELLMRILVGGVAVSGFSFLGGLLRPGTFAGLFAVALSVALATLVLTVAKDGKEYASIEARSMLIGRLTSVESPRPPKNAVLLLRRRAKCSSG